MSMRNAFEALATEPTLAEARDRLGRLIEVLQASDGTTVADAIALVRGEISTITGSLDIMRDRLSEQVAATRDTTTTVNDVSLVALTELEQIQGLLGQVRDAVARGAVATRAAVSHGETLLVPPGATSSLVSLTAPEGYSLFGFVATGETDAYFRLTVGDAPLLSGRIHATEQVVDVRLPVSLPIAGGVPVLLEVRNEGGPTASFEATLLGETR